MKETVIKSFFIFLIIMITVTMTAGKIRDFTSPTVAIMPIQKKIPNTAFINGSNKIYLAVERAAVFGKETYVTSIEVNKTATDGNFTLISDLYIPDASIVIDSDRPLRENVIVKTNQGPYLRIIKSKYRDVIAIRPALAYDNIIKMIDNLKEDINLLSEVWYETADTDSGSIILYVKAYEGCSEILEGQLVEYFSEGEIQVAVNLELKFRKIEYGIFIILSITLGSLLVCLIKSTKRSYKELKKSMAIDIKTFYTFDCIMKNMKGIAATAISALSACFIYYFLFTVMPLPPVPAYVIPEKLIYINDFVGVKQFFKSKTYNLIYILIAISFVLPMVQTFLLSFGKPAEIKNYFFENTLPLIPKSFSIEQYYDLLIHNSFYLRMFWMTLFISITSACLNLIVSLMSAYVLAKVSFRFRAAIIFMYIVAMMMPFQVTLLPNYLISKWTGLYDTIFALIIPAVFNPFGTFLLVQVIKTVDSETIEAASLETDKAMTILFRMVVPQIKAGLAAVFIISFADTWNMVEPVLILTKNPELRTLGTAFNDIYAYNSSIAFSGSVIYMLPVVFLYLMFEREIRDSFSVIRLHGH